MTRDGTVGRSDATERRLPSHWDIDAARMMRLRFGAFISGLQSIRTAGTGRIHASEFCAARYIFCCHAGGHPHMRRREFIALIGCGLRGIWSRTRAAALPTDATDRLICKPRVSQTIG